jgi:hypothetical protein
MKIGSLTHPVSTTIAVKIHQRRIEGLSHAALRSCYGTPVRFLFSLILGAGLVAAACDNKSDIYEDPGIQPQIVSAAGPAGGAVTCHPVDSVVDGGHIGTGGNCALDVQVTFHLPQGQFVDKAIVAFEGDGSDVGIDRHYPVANTFGQGDTDVTVKIPIEVPPSILRENALFTYTVKLVTGAGAQSVATTLTISVT